MSGIPSIDNELSICAPANDHKANEAAFVFQPEGACMAGMRNDADVMAAERAGEQFIGIFGDGFMTISHSYLTHL